MAPRLPQLPATAALRSALVPILPLLALLAVTMPAAAQRAGEAELRVQVRDAGTRQPLASVQVSIPGLSRGGVTDAEGRVTLDGLPAGSHGVEARQVGYGTARAEAHLVPGEPRELDLALELAPVEIESVRVRAKFDWLRTSGFYARRSSGYGTFITREEIETMNARGLTDVIGRAAGVSVTPSRNTGSRSHAVVRGRQRLVGPCSIQYYVDGIATDHLDIDAFVPEDVEGVEIYRGGATIPAAFNTGSPMCGVIVIWTRQN